MKVCLVSAEYPPMQGGVGDCTRELGRALVLLGHQVGVVTSVQARRLAANDTEQASRQPEEPVACRIVEKWNWRSWPKVLKAVQTTESEIVHIQYQTAAYGMHPAINFLPLRLRLARQRPRVVVTFHDLRVPYLFPKAGRVRDWVTLSLARWSDAVIGTNIEDYESLRCWLSGRRPVHLIPIGSNIHPQKPAGYDRIAFRRRLGIEDDELVLCYFGFLNESKGGETLFRAMADLVQRGEKVRLLMIGEQVGDSDPTNVVYAQRMRALQAELGLQDSVLWTGYMPSEQVSAHFGAADICVLPYRDGASYRRGSFMAALAHGLPIISTQPRVGVETLVDGENILLVPPDNPVATAQAVLLLRANPVMRARLSQGALLLAKSFTWDVIARKTADLYGELVGR